MANKYDVLAEQIELMYAGGDASADLELDRREIRLLVEQAHNRLISNSYFDNVKAEGEHNVNGQFKTLLTKLPIKKDEDRGESFVELPKSYISLPGNKGVDSVRVFGKPEAKPLIPVNTGFNDLYDGLKAGALENQIGYYPEGNKIFIANKSKRGNPAGFLNVRLVHGSPEAVGAEQDLVIIGEVTKILAARRPQDKSNDGAQQV